MAKIIHKKSSIPSKVPTALDLDYGELALNYKDGKLYFKNTTNDIVSFDSDTSSFVTLTGTQTLTNKTLTSPTITGGTLDNVIIGGTTPTTIIGTDVSATSTLKSLNSVGDEGGEILLAKAQTNTTLSGSVTIDVYQNKLRIFETSGSNRGVYIDLTSANTSVGTNLLGGAVGVTSVDGNAGAISAAQLLTAIKKEDGSGSGLDADLLDGLNTSSTNTISTVMTRDSSGLTGIGGLNLDTAYSGAGAVGRLNWNDGEGTAEIGLKGGNVTLQIGQEMVVLAYNGTGSTIADGKVVAISGAQGQRPSIILADADSESLSAYTLGIATESISNGAEGFVTTFGVVRGIDTSAFTEGAAVFLSQTAGGLTSTRPIAPAHTVFIGYVIKSHASSGEIFVNINNGWELSELHDVYINTVADGNLLKYNSTNSRWENATQASITSGDSDKLDGQHGSYYLDWTNVTNKPDPVITLAGDLSGSVTLTDLASGTLTATIAANSVALGTDTTGNYLATLASSGNTITVTGSGSESAAVNIDLPNSGVTTGSYGSSTAIPVISVDAQGRITSASTAAISSSLSIAGDTGTDTVTVGTDTLTITGGNAIDTTVTNNVITIDHADTSSVTNLSSDNTGNTFIQDISLTFDTYGHVTGASVATGTVTVGNGALTLATSGVGLSGSASFSANQSTGSTFTVISNATSDNTASTIVARDASGNFTAGTITATLSGNASTVTNGVYTTGSYADPAWITSINYSKLTGTVPTWNQNTTGSAAKWTTARTLSFTGDATGSGSVDGSANVATALTLANSGVTAGTYTKITVDAKGRATSGTTLAASDIPNLDASKITTGVLDAARLPSYVDDVLEYVNLAGFPVTGETGKIYVALDTNKTYRWSGSAYVYITSGAVDSVAGKTGVVTLVKGDVGLGNVDNTADANKNVLSATKLTTARTISLTGDVTGSVSFDGSGNAAIATTIAADSVALGTDTTGNYVASVATTAPLSGGAAGSEGGALTLSLASGYGDTQNPYASKTANTFLAAPNGAAGVPTFRAIVAADIPTLNQNTTGTASNITAYTINQNLGTSNAVTFDQVLSTNNGNGTNFKVGDDAWIGDINTANTIRVTGLQDATAGYIVFGNSNTTALGRTGTGALTYGGSALVTVGDTGTVTNTMLAGSIANSKLANSSITVNGTAISLGGSGTITATATNALTIGTGLSGTSYNGSSAVTVALATAYGDTTNPYASKAANYVLAAPNGSAGAPTFRAIVAADIPTLNQNTTGSAATLTTARTLTIGSTGKTFNGSADVSWSLSEIGASPTAGSTSLVTVGTITTGTWNAGAVTSSGAIQGTTLTSTVATGTAPLTVTSTTKVANLNVEQVDGYHADTSNTASTIAVRDASKNLAVSGVVLSGSTSGTSTLVASAAAGTTTLTLPATTGTLITSGDTGTVTSTMIADGTIVNADINASAAIAVSKLAASTISGVTLGNNLNTLTLNVSGTGLSGSTTYNGSAAATFTVTSNATNANTASAIVARDASGNFSAGTITAALSGNASTATSATTATNIAGGSAGTIPYQTAAGATAMLAAGTSGYFLKSNNTSAPSWAEMSLTDLPDAWVKKSVKAATTANITLSAPQTIDGIALVAGDRVLVKDQTTASQNGIYVVAAGAWTRATDANTISKLAGACVNVDSGTANGGFRFDNDNKTTDTLDTTSIVFFRVYDTNDSATALTVNKLVLRDANGDVNVRYANTEYVNMSHAAAARTTDTVFYSSTDNYIRKNTAAGFKQSLALNNVENTALSTWAGSANITTLGTIGTGTWNATTINTAKGGTGLTSFTANGAVYATSTSALTTGTLPVASGGTGVTTSTGSGSNVLSTSPTLVTPVIGAATGTSLTLTGALQAATKSFLIPHPTKEGKKLRYGSLEGPENGVYVRGKLKGSSVIELPEYWTKLVDPDSITVNLTCIGKYQKLYVMEIKDNKVYVGNENLWGSDFECFYTVYGERCDVEKLEVEID